MFSTPAGEVVRRDDTPRHFDREKRVQSLEFSLHGHATDWARAARVGDKSVIGGPPGSTIVPSDLAWQWLFAADPPEYLHCVSSVADLHAWGRELAVPEGEGCAWWRISCRHLRARNSAEKGCPRKPCVSRLTGKKGLQTSTRRWIEAPRAYGPILRQRAQGSGIALACSCGLPNQLSRNSTQVRSLAELARRSG